MRIALSRRAPAGELGHFFLSQIQEKALKDLSCIGGEGGIIRRLAAHPSRGGAHSLRLLRVLSGD